MAPRPIVKLPHSVLGRVAGDVPPAEIKSPKIQRLIAEMKATLRASPDGVGLAAPQIGKSLKIFLVSEEAAAIDAAERDANARGEPSRTIQMHANDTNTKRNWEHCVFINPIMVRHSRRKIEMHEGCLSVPGKFGLVPRYEKVELSWLDENGKKQGRGFTGFFARVIQHELDHLDGKLIADRAKELFKAIDDK